MQDKQQTLATKKPQDGLSLTGPTPEASMFEGDQEVQDKILQAIRNKYIPAKNTSSQEK